MNAIQHIWYLANSLKGTNADLELNLIKAKYESWWKQPWLWLQRYILQCNCYSEAEELVRAVHDTPKDELRSLDALFASGKSLFEAKKFKYARECFSRILEVNNDDNQDIRLPALMGKLESIIASEPSNDDKANRIACMEAEELYRLIAEDLNATRHQVRADLMVRLAYAKIRMGVFEIRSIVVRDMKMLRKHGFM